MPRPPALTDHAQRVAVNGHWINPHAPHGTENGYKNYKCRCGPCRTAQAVCVRNERARRATHADIVDGRRHVHTAPHGSLSGYDNHGCRCDSCRRAKAVSRKLQETADA